MKEFETYPEIPDPSSLFNLCGWNGDHTVPKTKGTATFPSCSLEPGFPTTGGKWKAEITACASDEK